MSVRSEVARERDGNMSKEKERLNVGRVCIVIRANDGFNIFNRVLTGNLMTQNGPPIADQVLFEARELHLQAAAHTGLYQQHYLATAIDHGKANSGIDITVAFIKTGNLVHLIL